MFKLTVFLFELYCLTANIIYLFSVSVWPAADAAGQQRCLGAEEELCPHGADRADPEPGELGHLLHRLPRKGERGE